MSRPSTEISPGGRALAEPLIFIWSCTGWPTAVSELLRTAVTLAEPAAKRWLKGRNGTSATSPSRVAAGMGIHRASLISDTLPVLIDMARRLAFIKLDPLLFVLHRL